jgi:ATP-dependent helicase Lhr and Lhr-like helicase
LAALDLLHPYVQRWIASQGWTQLRPIQSEAIAPILQGQTDVIIAAATAGGKTEAAFLPIFSQLASQPQPSIQVIAISPLKALINDQHRRLSDIGESMDIPVLAWHGDIAANRKQKLLQNPQGIVIITPESLEALLARRGPQLLALFAHLQYLVIDEMHVFIGSERGRQLQSLMHRLDGLLEREIPRIGLSATLGDMGLAAAFLRPGAGETVHCIHPPQSGGELRLQLRGYQRSLSDQTAVDLASTRALRGEATADEAEISAHLFQVARGHNTLIFVNGRATVERYTDLLREQATVERVPNEFWPHHGSLAKELREEVEDRLRDDLPATVVCTTTLEMGLDVGDVKSIAQVGAPLSVASIRQRLGRSGRRAGEPAIARFYLTVPELTADGLPQDAIHPELVQAIAMINLLLNHWCEPPAAERLHLSTLIQQFLSLLSQMGGCRADVAWEILCGTGPFPAVDTRCFRELLHGLAQTEIIHQIQDGSLLLSPKGERMVGHYSFYSAFATSEDYRLLHEGRLLGQLPTALPLVTGMRIIFAGRRWQVESVDEERCEIQVIPATGGQVPRFSGAPGAIHDRVRQTMFDLYCNETMPVYLDPIAQRLLQEARSQFRQWGLEKDRIIAQGQQAILFAWQGDLVLNTILVQLLTRGLKAARDGIAIAVQNCTPLELQRHLGELVDAGPADAVELAIGVKNKRLDKYDYLLSEALLTQNYASAQLAVEATWATMKQIIAQ